MFGVFTGHIGKLVCPTQVGANAVGFLVPAEALAASYNLMLWWGIIWSVLTGFAFQSILVGVLVFVIVVQYLNHQKFVKLVKKHLEEADAKKGV